VNLNGKTGQVAIYNNDNSIGNTPDSINDYVNFAGTFRNGELELNNDVFRGTAYFTAQNSLSGLTLNSGHVSTKLGTQIGRLFDADNGGDLIINGGAVEAFGAEKITNLNIDTLGTAIFYADLGLDAAENGGELVTIGGLTANSFHNLDSGVLVATGNVTVANSLTNDGNIALAANLSATNIQQNGTIALIGNVVDDVETAATRTISFTRLLSDDTSLILGATPENTVQNNLILENKGASMFQGSIRSGGTVTVTGGGDLWLTGASQLTGTLNINNATLTMVENSSLTNFGLGAPAPTLDVVVGEGGVYRTNAVDNIRSLTNNHSVLVINSLNVHGTFTQNAGITDVNGSARLTVGGIAGTGGEIRISQDATFAAYQAGNTTYSGKMTGVNSTFTKYNAGDLTLNGAAGSISVGNIDIQGGGLILDGANILAQNVSVNIGQDGRIALLNGDQSISHLTGTGLLALNGNRLLLVNGGNFSGLVTGAGELDFSDGEFDLPGSIDTDGTVNVGDADDLQDGADLPIVNIGGDNSLSANILNVFGILNVDGTVNADAMNLYKLLNLAGSLNADNSHVDGGTLHLGNGNVGGLLNSGTTLVNNGGTITGVGKVAGVTTVGGESAGYLAPGNSPGVLILEELILGNMATPIMELAGVAGAGLATD
jgi:hypothetical protein